MRDSFETYFTGWVINSDLTPDEKNDFAALSHEVGLFVNGNADIQQDWKAFVLDVKRDLYLHFFYKYIEKGQVPAHLTKIVDYVKTTYKKK